MATPSFEEVVRRGSTLDHLSCRGRPGEQVDGGNVGYELVRFAPPRELPGV
jgi:hypothetical protein